MEDNKVRQVHIEDDLEPLSSLIFVDYVGISPDELLNE